ncbi:MAG: type II toxin-antitoxin system VapC family toxin [Lacunisphaera sp.]|nr:type II toxin-antitoxin system VapC family toxin [Lacunisphaera sp.]
MSWLLDTCVICEPTRKSPSGRVSAWLDAQPEETLYLSVLTLGEIRKGVARMPAGPKRKNLERWLEHVLVERFAGRILPVDAEVADVWGRLQGTAQSKGRPLPTLDSLLAATARANGLTLVTRNSADFAGTGAELLNPWD